MAQENKVCKICEKIGHSRYYCKEKGFKQVKYTASTNKVSQRAPKKPTISKPIRKSGKYGEKWVSTKKEWKKLNPPDENGFWYCKVGGSALIDHNYSDFPGAYALNVCHDISRARSRSKAYDIDNLFPGCQRHNKLQGSKSLKEFLRSKPNLQCGNS